MQSQRQCVSTLVIAVLSELHMWMVSSNGCPPLIVEGHEDDPDEAQPRDGEPAVLRLGLGKHGAYTHTHANTTST